MPLTREASDDDLHTDTDSLSRRPAAGEAEPDQGDSSAVGPHHRLLPTLAGVVSACSAVLSGGMMLVFPASLIPDLQAEEGDLHIDLEQGSWIREFVVMHQYRKRNKRC